MGPPLKKRKRYNPNYDWRILWPGYIRSRKEKRERETELVTKEAEWPAKYAEKNKDDELMEKHAGSSEQMSSVAEYVFPPLIYYNPKVSGKQTEDFLLLTVEPKVKEFCEVFKINPNWPLELLEHYSQDLCSLCDFKINSWNIGKKHYRDMLHHEKIKAFLCAQGIIYEEPKLINYDWRILWPGYIRSQKEKRERETELVTKAAEWAAKYAEKNKDDELMEKHAGSSERMSSVAEYVSPLISYNPKVPGKQTEDFLLLTVEPKVKEFCEVFKINPNWPLELLEHYSQDLCSLCDFKINSWNIGKKHYRGMLHHEKIKAFLGAQGIIYEEPNFIKKSPRKKNKNINTSRVPMGPELSPFNFILDCTNLPKMEIWPEGYIYFGTADSKAFTEEIENFSCQLIKYILEICLKATRNKENEKRNEAKKRKAESEDYEHSSLKIDGKYRKIKSYSFMLNKELWHGRKKISKEMEEIPEINPLQLEAAITEKQIREAKLLYISGKRTLYFDIHIWQNIYNIKKNLVTGKPTSEVGWLGFHKSELGFNKSESECAILEEKLKEVEAEKNRINREVSEKILELSNKYSSTNSELETVNNELTILERKLKDAETEMSRITGILNKKRQPAMMKSMWDLLASMAQSQINKLANWVNRKIN